MITYTITQKELKDLKKMNSLKTVNNGFKVRELNFHSTSNGYDIYTFRNSIGTIDRLKVIK